MRKLGEHLTSARPQIEEMEVELAEKNQVDAANRVLEGELQGRDIPETG